MPDIQKLSEIGGGKPIFETLLIFENFLKHPSWKQAEKFTVQFFRHNGWTNYPLAIEAMPPDGKNPLYFQVKYDMNYFTEEDIRTLLDSLRDYLQALAKRAWQDAEGNSAASSAYCLDSSFSYFAYLARFQTC